MPEQRIEARLALNYLKGVRLERRLVTYLKKVGALVCQRSAGSHSLIDVFSITVNGQPEYFSCKTDGKWSKREETELRALQAALGTTCRVFFVFLDKGQVEFRQANRPPSIVHQRDTG